MNDTIRKVVFPAAGLGTRFLPATKAIPKEMLVLVNRPVIQYGVEEAVQSGADQIVIVTGRGKSAMEDHFDTAYKLESVLSKRGKVAELEQIRNVTRLCDVAYVRQGEPLGLGHAVLCAENIVGSEPFGVVLGDDVIDADPPALRQLIDVYRRVKGPVIAVERVPADRVSSYGIVAVTRADGAGKGVHRITDLVEKPSPEEAPSNLAIIGRYVLTPDIFAELHDTPPDRSGEVQLTNGLRRLLARRPLYACEIDGVRHDTGSKIGYLKATFYFAMKRPDVANACRHYVNSLALPAI